MNYSESNQADKANSTGKKSEMSTSPIYKATGNGPLEQAALQISENQPFILADFARSNCHGCELLERHTLSHPDVATFVADHFVFVRLLLDQPDHQPYFRRFSVIWTPTLLFLDRDLIAHYQSPGYLPTTEALAVSRIGLARCMMSRSRLHEACRHLESVANLPDQPFAAEALFWLGMARYLTCRREEDLESAWNILKSRHPNSPWARRIPSQINSP
ncbi:MAG: thioredoxin fold domain-containing protein [Gemmataceae bacterium]